MKTFLIAVLLCVFQYIVIDPSTRMPAFIDPQYGIDGRALIPEPVQSDIIIYNIKSSQGKPQESWIIRPLGDGTAAAIPLISDDDE